MKWIGPFLLLVLLLPGGRVASAQNAGLGTGEVEVEVETFGVAQRARQGSMAGVRVRLRNLGNQNTEVIVRIEGVDRDGDTPLIDRTINANFNVWLGVWLYIRLPNDFEQSEQVTVSVFEAIEAGDRFRAGRLLARTFVQARVSDKVEEIWGIVGGGQYRLGDYGNGLQMAPLSRAFGQGRVDVAPNIRISDLPDHWYGLQPFDILFFGQVSPTELRPEAASSIIEWVRRGGHLVVILPPADQSWFNPDSNPLHSILPAVRATRTEDADLEPLRPLLTANELDEKGEPLRGPLYTFEPVGDDAFGADASVVLQDAEERAVVVRRRVGVGMVTMIGVHLDSTAMKIDALPDPTRFWNRVLGRVGQIPTAAEVRNANPQPSLRDPVYVDKVIESEIRKFGAAAAGVLLGFVVFATYWVVAGPGGFGLLKVRGWTRHAWISFFVAGIAFTAIAWGGATIIRPKRVDVTHRSYLIHVYGQPVQRSRTWMTVLLPWYGEATLQVGEADDDREQADLITWWEPPYDGAAEGGFPDAQGYVIDTRRQDSITVPTRSTVKQFMADWSGPPVWPMPRPTGEPTNERGESFLEFVDDDSSDALVRGTLVHDLPGSIRELRIVVNQGQSDLAFTNPNLLFDTYAFSADAAFVWEPGVPLQLDRYTIIENRREARFDEWLRQTLQRATRGEGARQADERMLLLPFLGATPVPPEGRGMFGGATAAGLTSQTHGIELSAHLTQPCVMILGVVESDVCPTPLEVREGSSVRRASVSGDTVVCWVYPMPSDPPVVPKPPETSDADGP